MYQCTEVWQQQTGKTQCLCIRKWWHAFHSSQCLSIKSFTSPSSCWFAFSFTTFQRCKLSSGLFKLRHRFWMAELMCSGVYDVSFTLSMLKDYSGLCYFGRLCHNFYRHAKYCARQVKYWDLWNITKKKSNEARNTSSQTVRQAKNSQTYVKKTNKSERQIIIPKSANIYHSL